VLDARKPGMGPSNLSAFLQQAKYLSICFYKQTIGPRAHSGHKSKETITVENVTTQKWQLIW
jgi:hypothetical protein